MKKVLLGLFTTFIIVSLFACASAPSNPEALGEENSGTDSEVIVEEPLSIEEVMARSAQYLTDQQEEGNIKNFEIYQNDTMKEAGYFDLNLILLDAYLPAQVQQLEDRIQETISAYNAEVYFRIRSYKSIELDWMDVSEAESYTRETWIPEINFILEKTSQEARNVVFDITYKEEDATIIENVFIELRYQSQTPEPTLQLLSDEIETIMAESVFQDFLSLR